MDVSLLCFIGFFVAILIGAGLGFGAAALVHRCPPNDAEIRKALEGAIMKVQGIDPDPNFPKKE